MSRFAGSLLLMVCSCVYAQTFEVASIRPSAPPQMGRGPGQIVRFGPSGGAESKDPTRYTCDGCNLMMLIMQAYNVRPYQMVNAPQQMGPEGRFDLRATLAPGTTKEQQRVMLQNLLAERFGLKVHHESKEMQLYELVVAKGGPKLTPSVEEPPKEKVEADPAEPPRLIGPRDLKLDKDGFPMLPAGSNGMIGMNGRMRLSASKQTMADLAMRLADQLAKPVKDATGLPGKYDFTLSFAMEMGAMGPMGPGRAGMAPPPPPPPGSGGGDIPAAMSPDGGPTIFAAVQQQLGLKLEGKKGQADVIVIDHFEKVPTEN